MAEACSILRKDAIRRKVFYTCLSPMMLDLGRNIGGVQVKDIITREQVIEDMSDEYMLSDQQKIDLHHHYPVTKSDAYLTDNISNTPFDMIVDENGFRPASAAESQEFRNVDSLSKSNVKFVPKGSWVCAIRYSQKLFDYLETNHVDALSVFGECKRVLVSDLKEYLAQVKQ